MTHPYLTRPCRCEREAVRQHAVRLAQARPHAPLRDVLDEALAAAGRTPADRLWALSRTADDYDAGYADGRADARRQAYEAGYDAGYADARQGLPAYPQLPEDLA